MRIKPALLLVTKMGVCRTWTFVLIAVAIFASIILTSKKFIVYANAVSYSKLSIGPRGVMMMGSHRPWFHTHEGVRLTTKTASKLKRPS